MPTKIKWIWVICSILVFVGFVYLSYKSQVKQFHVEEQKKVEKKRERLKEEADRKKAAFKIAEKIVEIKELNALGKYNEAGKLAAEVIEQDPNNSVAYTWWGVSLVKSGKPVDALDKFTKSAKLDPNYPQTYIYWGLTLAMQNQFKDAIIKYQTALQLDSNNSNAYAYWGAALGRLGKYKESIKKLEEALVLNKFNENAYGVLVDSLYHERDYKKAWEIVNRARNAKISISKASIERLKQAMPEPK